MLNLQPQLSPTFGLLSKTMVKSAMPYFTTILPQVSKSLQLLSELCGC